MGFGEKMPPAAETPAEQVENEEKAKSEEPVSLKNESKFEKVKGIMVKIGDTVKEYAPAAMVGAATGALAWAAEQYKIPIDRSVIEFMTSSENIQAFYMSSRHWVSETNNNPAVWSAVMSGLSVLFIKWKNTLPPLEGE